MHPLHVHSDIERLAIDTRWPVVICLLGSFRILKDGEPVSIRAGGKLENLVICLALENGLPVRREVVLEALWPSAELALASQSLNTLVYGSHKLFDDVLGEEPLVLCKDGSYQLNREGGVWTDIDVFQALVRTGDELLRDGNRPRAFAAYNEAVEMYQGDLCVDDSTRSLILREHLRATYLTILARLADYYQANGDHASCLAMASRLLAKDPCREDAHRMVMRCHVRLGARAQALRQYRVCEQVLRSEFDAAPEPETAHLFDQIRLAPEQV